MSIETAYLNTCATMERDMNGAQRMDLSTYSLLLNEMRCMGEEIGDAGLCELWLDVRRNADLEEYSA